MIFNDLFGVIMLLLRSLTVIIHKSVDIDIIIDI